MLVCGGIFSACMLAGCAPREYHDFSFRPVNQHLAFQETPLFDFKINELCPPKTECRSYLISENPQLSLLYQFNEVCIFRNIAALDAATWQQVQSHTERMLLLTDRDTLDMTDLLGPDTAYLSCLPFAVWDLLATYDIQTNKRGQRYLFSSFGNLSANDLCRINLVLEIIGNRLTVVNAYGTYTFLNEREPCSQCFTDYNNDGTPDFIQLPPGTDAEPNPAVWYINFTDGQRKYIDSGYRAGFAKRNGYYLPGRTLVAKRFRKKYSIRPE